jgi:hypothetical protein
MAGAGSAGRPQPPLLPAMPRAVPVEQALIRRAAEQFEAERMAVEADAFIAALQRDLIDAADFA